MKIDTEKFVAMYKTKFKENLSSDQKKGICEILNFMQDDPLLLGLSEEIATARMAYMLATIKHECANRYAPIEEFGKGSGKEYGKPVKFTDSSVNPPSVSYPVFYGRGYVQLTWYKNYQDMSIRIFGDRRMIANPKLALVPEIAYKIMSIGMKEGTFTNGRNSFDQYTPVKKLKNGSLQYGQPKPLISGKTIDFFNSRHIINGTDCAEKIAGFAVIFSELIRTNRIYEQGE